MSTVKICVNCKYCKHLGYGAYRCTNKEAIGAYQLTDPVTGFVSEEARHSRICMLQRDPSLGRCGADAKFFQPRQPFWTRIVARITELLPYL